MQFPFDYKAALFLFLTLLSTTLAASEPRIQVINEHMRQLEVHPFLLDNLKSGDKLYIRIDPTSGSLEPVIALVEADVDQAYLEKMYEQEVLERVGTNNEYQVLFHEFADRYLGKWNQGGGKQGALTFDVGSNTAYTLLIFGADSWIAGQEIASFGDYRLQIGVNAPDVIDQEVVGTSSNIAYAQHDLRRAVQEYEGALPDNDTPLTLPLAPIGVGETLSIFIETDNPAVNPSVKLRDYGGRLLSHDNIYGSERTAVVEHLFISEDQTPTLEVSGLRQSRDAPLGEFRLLLGINAPEVLEGNAIPVGRNLVRYPIPVAVGIGIDQITSISQKDENFAIVGEIEMEWVDPRLAFNPSTCKCNKKTLSILSFRELAGDKGVSIPNYIIVNQQGKRHTQEQTITVRPDGSAQWYERLSVTLQAPDFDLRRLPFDHQKFFIRIALLESTRNFVFITEPEYSVVGQHLGEEEWRIIETEIDISESVTREIHSQFSFMLHAERHVMYYVVRIFVPLFLLTAVAWVTFFLRDYSKRVDVSAGNLLAFIAFNFTLGSDMPRLGYLTFLDQLMVIAFAFAALMVIYNVVMRRLERSGMPVVLETIDSLLLWAYPLMTLAAVWATWEITG
jgi:hypothetical protein